MLKRHVKLREDPSVKRWFENLRRGSALTAEVSIRRLGKLCELLGTTPQGILDLAGKNVGKFQDCLEDLVGRLEGEGKAPGYIAVLLMTIKSFLRYHDIVLTRKIKITGSGTSPTIEDEQVPTQEELARIFRVSPPRTRVAEALVAFSDLRLGVLGNHDGSDGLALRDLPEIRVDNVGREVAFERIPTMVVVRASLSKTKHKYFTFLPQEGCTYLQEYLEGRLRSGERLGSEDPVIGHERSSARNPFCRTNEVARDIRTCMRAAGVKKRPYVLRAYAETQFTIAESRGLIPHAYFQFFAGHKGDMEARYSTNKGRLPPDMVEDMRQAYARCEPYLCTSVPEHVDVIKDARIEALKAIAKNMFGLDITINGERPATKDEEIQLLEERLAGARQGRLGEIMDALTHDEEFVAFLRRKLAELKAEGKL